MATPTRDEQEDAFAKRLYDIARAAGLAAREAANGLISVRFVGIDEVGIGSVDLCATSLDWKTLQHVALYLGARREGRSLFSLELQAEGGGYDALFSAEQFEEFMESCTARLQAAAAEGFSKVRAYVGLLRCARSLSHFTLQINVTFRLKKFVLEKEYTSGERDAAAVGGQQKPHTIAQAIVQLEHCRDVAQMRSEAAAGAQGSNTEAPATLLAAGAAPLPASAVVTAASPAPTPISTAAVAASVLQARIAAAIREEQVAAAKAATKRKELTALRSELSMFATQAAGSNAQPLGRRVHAPRAGAVRPPDLAEHI